MKTIITLSLLLIVSLSYSQHAIIEAGPSFLKNYSTGINAGASLLFSKTQSGIALGAEVYKSNDLPIGIPVFARGVITAKNGLVLNIQAGYMFMNKTYDDGTAKIGGLYSKFGAGYMVAKKIHLLVNFVGAQVEKEFNYGANIMIGVRI